MYKVYIIKSEVTDRFYIGHTENFQNRLKRHNAGLVRSTKSGIPWYEIYIEEVNDKNLAYRREMQIKSYKGGEAFKKLIKI